MPFCARELLSALRRDMESFIDVSISKWSIDDSPREAACYRQLESLVKKFNQADGPSETATGAALKKFKEVNQRCALWTDQVNYEWEAELMNAFKNEVHRFYYQGGNEPLFSDYNQLFLLGRTGPGASIGAVSTDLYSKLFGSPLSATPSLPDIWETCYLRNTQLHRALCYGGAFPQYQVVGFNKLSFVNKTDDIARSICTEPSINMWMQLGLGSLIESRLKVQYGIDLSLQPKINQGLARLGSISDRYATVDLESASDSMSLRMLQWCLPKSFREVLLRLRSPRSRLPDGSLVDLNMVSTMGNGFTFPLQTALFSCAVVATYRYLKIEHHPFDDGQRSWSVFGDDIIIVKEAARHVIHLLELLGFRVNRDKTFVEGPFRESCGADWFSGVDIRPVFVKRMRTIQDAFVAINGLNLWSSKSGVYIPRTIAYILRFFPKCLRYPVPCDEDDAAGLKLPRELLTARQAKPLRRGFGLITYTAFIPVPNQLRVDVDGGTIEGRKKVPYNPEGLFVAFLHGSVRGYRIGVRQTSVRYITKRRLTPRWGYLPPQTLSGNPDRYTLFLRACEGNLLLPSGWMS